MSIPSKPTTDTCDAGADVDPSEFDADTIADGVPVEPRTPPVEVTGRHRLALTPADFASAIDLTDRDAFARGEAHGRAEAEADAVTELRRVREDVIETLRGLWVIWDIQKPTWEEAEPWIRHRLTPL